VSETSEISPKRPKKSRPIPPDFVARRAAGESIDALGRAYGATHGTVQKWEEKRADEIEQARQEISKEALLQVRSMVGLALSTVRSVLTDDLCPACNRPASSPKDRLKASEMMMDRGGLPKVQHQVLSGSVRSDPIQDRRLVLEAAIAILDEEGHSDLAAQLRGVV
jgi:hypothetical protein